MLYSSAQLIALANKFELVISSTELPISVENPPVSAPPISIERHKDIIQSVKDDITKSNYGVSFIALEIAQKHLTHALTKSMERHGYNVSQEEVNKQLMNFGEYGKAEQEFMNKFNDLFAQYGGKALHYIINNLSR